MGAALADQEAEERAAREEPAGYIVAISQRGRFRRLHFAGTCWRIPGLHYHKFEDYGDTVPTAVHARCSDCFPSDSAAERKLEAEEAALSDGGGSVGESDSEVEDEEDDDDEEAAAAP